MLDVFGAIFATAVYATVVGVLVGLSSVRAVSRLAACVAAAAWLGIIVAVATLGGLAPGVLGPVPAILLPFVGLSRYCSQAGSVFRNALLSLPLPALVGLNVARLGVFFFLLLYADGRPPALETWPAAHWRSRWRRCWRSASTYLGLAWRLERARRSRPRRGGFAQRAPARSLSTCRMP